MAEFGPAAIEIASLVEDFVAGEQVDFEKIQFGLEAWDFFFELGLAPFMRSVALAEFFDGELLRHIEPEDFIHFLLDRDALAFEDGQQFGPLLDGLVSFLQVLPDGVRREEVAAKLLNEDVFEVHNGDLVGAVPTNVFRSIDFDVHLAAAQAAPCQAAEELDGLLGGPPGLGLLFEQDGIATVPEFFRDNGLAGKVDPLGLGLEFPAAGAADPAGVVGSPDALGGRVGDQVFDGLVLKKPAAAAAMAALVEQARHGGLALVLQKEFVAELADWGLFGMRREALIFPLVAEWSRASRGFAEFSPDGNRGGHPRPNFFPFPVGHRRNHRVEEPAGGGGRVD